MVGADAMGWKKLLAYISASVDDELLLRNEYLGAENPILRPQIGGRLKLNDGEHNARERLHGLLEYYYRGAG